MGRRGGKSITIRRTYVADTEPDAALRWQEAEEILARLVAQSYLAEHPELLGEQPKATDGQEQGERQSH